MFKNSIKYSIKTLIVNFRMFIYLFLSFLGIKIIYKFFSKLVKVNQPTTSNVLIMFAYKFIVYFIYTILLSILVICILKIFLNLYDKKKTKPKQLYLTCRKKFSHYFQTLIILEIVFGVLFFLISTTAIMMLLDYRNLNLILAWFHTFIFVVLILITISNFSVLIFTNYFVIDKKYKPIKSISTIYKASKGRRIKIMMLLIKYIIFWFIIQSVINYFIGYIQVVELSIYSHLIISRCLALLFNGMSYFLGISMYVYFYRHIFQRGKI